MLYAVVPHAIGGKPTGRGHVVRSLPFDRNYRGLEPVKVYQRERAAQAFADKLYDARSTGLESPRDALKLAGR